jgi:hypothetical protein
MAYWISICVGYRGVYPFGIFYQTEARLTADGPRRYMNLAIQISQLYDAAKNAPVTISQIERLEQELSGIRNREIDFTASNRRIEGDKRESIDEAKNL